MFHVILIKPYLTGEGSTILLLSGTLTLCALEGDSLTLFSETLLLPLPLFLFTAADGTTLSTTFVSCSGIDGGGGGGGGLGLAATGAACCLTFVCESGLPDCTGKCLNCPFTLNITDKKVIFNSIFQVMSEKFKCV